MSTTQTIGVGFVLPGLISLICLTLATRSDRRRPRALLGAFVFGAIPLWAYWLDLGPLWPAENWQWLVWLALLSCLLNTMATNNWTLWISYTLFVILAAWRLVPDVERLADERWYWLVIVPIVLLVSLASTILLSHRFIGSALPFYYLLATLAAAALIFSASLGKSAQLTGILAGVMAGCWLASYCSPTRALFSTLAPGWAVLYPGLLIEARLYSYSEVPLVSYVLLLCAPLTIWLTAIPPLRKMKPVWRTALTLLLLLAPIAIGLYWAGQVAIEEVTEADVPRWLLQILRRLLGKSPLTDLEE
jgi:hypothetical protein